MLTSRLPPSGAIIWARIILTLATYGNISWCRHELELTLAAQRKAEEQLKDAEQKS